MSSDEHPDNVLFEWYERYIGEPVAETDVYLGFGLFFGAVAAAVLGLVLFAFGAGVYGLRTESYFAFAQPAYALGMLSVPLALLAIVVLLPVERRATYGATVGIAVTAAAVIAFLVYYPSQWFEFGTRNTLLVVGTYALGLAIVTAATGAALVAHQLERARPPTPSEIESSEDNPEETISDEEIRADIDEAMADTEVTWGGVEKTENRRLDFSADFVDESMGEVDVEANRTVSSGGVDAQVAGLKQLKGGTAKTDTSTSTVDDQLAALNELKEQRERDEIPSNAPTSEQGLLARLLSRLGLR